MDLQAIAHTLIADNHARIFPSGQGPTDIIGIAVGSRKFIREDRFHRILVVRYRAGGENRTLRLWLKFRPHIDVLLPVLDAYYERLNGQVFPRPYFAWHSPQNDTAVLATAYVRGTLLRNRLLLAALVGRADRLAQVFRSSGSKMRRFHDAFPAAGSVATADIVAQTLRQVLATAFLSSSEKQAIRSQIERHAAAFTTKTLPTVKIHSDWILRNIIVARDGTDYVVDCDSMRQDANLRWFDIGYTLLNMESQLKWFPLVTIPVLSKLWLAFWEGYVGEAGAADGLTPAQACAILYLVRLQYLLGGTMRGPLVKTLDSPFTRRFLLGVRRSLVVGRCTQLKFPDEVP